MQPSAGAQVAPKWKQVPAPALVQVKLFDRARGEKILHERTLRPGAFRVAQQLLDSRTAASATATRCARRRSG